MACCPNSCAFLSKGLFKCICGRKWRVSILYVLVYPWRFRTTHNNYSIVIIFIENIKFTSQKLIIRATQFWNSTYLHKGGNIDFIYVKLDRALEIIYGAYVFINMKCVVNLVFCSQCLCLEPFFISNGFPKQINHLLINLLEKYSTIIMFKFSE